MVESIIYIDLSRAVDVLLSILVQHNVAHILNIGEVLCLKTLDQLGDVLFLDPDEDETVLHDICGDLDVGAKVVDRDSGIATVGNLRLLTAFILGGIGVFAEDVDAVPWRVDQYGLYVLCMLVQVLTLHELVLFAEALDDAGEALLFLQIILFFSSLWTLINLSFPIHNQIKNTNTIRH